MSDLPAQVSRSAFYNSYRARDILGKVLKGRLKKTDAARSLGISRKTIYQWLERYVEFEPVPRTLVLRRVSKKERLKADVLRIVVTNPKFGPKKISEELKGRGKKLSVRSVWLILRELDLQKKENREDCALRFRKPTQAKDNDFPLHLRLKAEARKRMVEEVLISGRKVSEVAVEFKVCGKTFGKF